MPSQIVLTEVEPFELPPLGEVVPKRLTRCDICGRDCVEIGEDGHEWPAFYRIEGSADGCILCDRCLPEILAEEGGV